MRLVLVGCDVPAMDDSSPIGRRPPEEGGGSCEWHPFDLDELGVRRVLTGDGAGRLALVLCLCTAQPLSLTPGCWVVEGNDREDEIWITP